MKAKQLLAEKYFKLNTESIKALKQQFIDSDRSTGKTTREVDRAIQELLTTGQCSGIDPTGDSKSDKEFVKRIFNRMALEHHMFRLEYKDFTISIVGLYE